MPNDQSLQISVKEKLLESLDPVEEKKAVENERDELILDIYYRLALLEWEVV